MITLYGKKTSFLVGSILIVLLLLPAAVQSAEKENLPGKRIAVIPFQALLPEEGSTAVVCSLCGGVYSSGKIENGAEKAVQDSFMEKLRDLKEAQIIPLEKVAAVYNRVRAEALKKRPVILLKDVGAEVQADVIVVGYVYRYTERVGYDLSAERPASVAFEIHLIDVKDGGTLWRGVFDKTQKSLMEDVFQASSFFKGGGRWLTASQLAKQGIDEIFKTFPGFEQ